MLLNVRLERSGLGVVRKPLEAPKTVRLPEGDVNCVPEYGNRSSEAKRSMTSEIPSWRRPCASSCAIVAGLDGGSGCRNSASISPPIAGGKNKLVSSAAGADKYKLTGAEPTRDSGEPQYCRLGSSLPTGVRTRRT